MVTGVFEDFQTLTSQVLLWSIACFTCGAVFAVHYIGMRRWIEASVTLAAAAALAWLVSHFAIYNFSAMGWVQLVPPVNP